MEESLTVGIKSVGISVQDSLRRAQCDRGRVPICVVIGTRAVDTIGMSELVKSGGGLILGVAGA
jgi:hypothetical protein